VSRVLVGTFGYTSPRSAILSVLGVSINPPNGAMAESPTIEDAAHDARGALRGNRSDVWPLVRSRLGGVHVDDALDGLPVRAPLAEATSTRPYGGLWEI
jgi:hypothetical protein